MASEFMPGDVLAVEWNTRAIRVIQADASETFYNVEWDQHRSGLDRARTAIFHLFNLCGGNRRSRLKSCRCSHALNIVSVDFR